MSLLIPSVVETTQRGERSADLYSQLLSNRIVFIGHPIGTEVANLVCAQILHLAADRPQSPVHTTCFGLADTDRNLSLGAADAMAYGLVDEVLSADGVNQRELTTQKRAVNSRQNEANSRRGLPS